MDIIFNCKTVTFFGHRKIDNYFETEKKVERIVNELIRNEPYVEFLVGKNGDFDQIATSAIKKAERNIRDDNCSLVLVLPYFTKETEDFQASYAEFYDEIEICNQSAASHFKSAYKIRNRYMIDRSDLIIFYVNRENGGAYEALRYAKQQDKNFLIINEQDS